MHCLFLCFWILLCESTERRNKQIKEIFTPRFQLSPFNLSAPPLQQVPECIQVAWEKLSTKIDLPITQSRMNDLVWEIRAEGSKDHAKKAIDAYLELSQINTWECPVDCLSRALELSHAISDTPRMERASKATIAYIKQDLASTTEGSGFSYILLRALEKLPDAQKPKQLNIFQDQLHSSR